MRTCNWWTFQIPSMTEFWAENWYCTPVESMYDLIHRLWNRLSSTRKIKHCLRAETLLQVVVVIFVMINWKDQMFGWVCKKNFSAFKKLALRTRLCLHLFMRIICWGRSITSHCIFLSLASHYAEQETIFSSPIMPSCIHTQKTALICVMMMMLMRSWDDDLKRIHLKFPDEREERRRRMIARPKKNLAFAAARGAFNQARVKGRGKRKRRTATFMLVWDGW